MRAPTGPEIQHRLDHKHCVQCGVRPALEWPYVCHYCQQNLAGEQEAQRLRQDADVPRDVAQKGK